MATKKELELEVSILESEIAEMELEAFKERDKWRYRFAGLAMQEIMRQYPKDHPLHQDFYKDMVRHADALLAELEKTEGEK